MPYPFTDADQLVPLEDLLNAVVEAANARVQFGSGSVTTSGAGTPADPSVGSATVTFPVAFPPGSDVVVVVGVAGTTAVGQRFALAQGVSETGFTIRVGSSAGTGQAVSYTWSAGIRSVAP